jgi:hypothetical protein
MSFGPRGLQGLQGIPGPVGPTGPRGPPSTVPGPTGPASLPIVAQCCCRDGSNQQIITCGARIPIKGSTINPFKAGRYLLMCSIDYTLLDISQGNVIFNVKSEGNVVAQFGTSTAYNGSYCKTFHTVLDLTGPVSIVLDDKSDPIVLQNCCTEFGCFSTVSITLIEVQ